MHAHIKLGRVFGVEIGLHYSWFLVAALIVLSLAQHFASQYPYWGSGVVWLSATLTGVLFFVSIIVHEMSHALVAQSHGLAVRSITLFALGGLAQIEQEASDSRTEFWMGIAGPFASLAIGFGCLATAIAFGWDAGYAPASAVIGVLVWLGYINVSLAVFNMIPGFPLDGGRVLRAALWWLSGDVVRATRVASRIGQLVAAAFIVLGLLRFSLGAGLGGLWIAFIGWFLMSAAGANRGQVDLTERLRGVRVRDVMARDCATVDGRTNLQGFVEDYLLRTGRRCFVVVEDGAVAGLVTPREVKGVKRSRWPFTLVEDVMRPLVKLKSVSPEAPVSDSLEAMGREDEHQLPVVFNGRLEGIISRANIVQFLKTQAELHA